MPSDAPTLKDVRSLCGWPGCRREANVQVECGPGEAIEQVPAIGARGGRANLCADHAADLRARLVPGRLLSEKIIR
jgi:hypothetical protein